MYEVDEATVIHLDLLPAYIAKNVGGCGKHFRVLPTEEDDCAFQIIHELFCFQGIGISFYDTKKYNTMS